MRLNLPPEQRHNVGNLVILFRGVEGIHFRTFRIAAQRNLFQRTAGDQPSHNPLVQCGHPLHRFCGKDTCIIFKMQQIISAPLLHHMERQMLHGVFRLVNLQRDVSTGHCDSGEHIALIYEAVRGADVVFTKKLRHWRTVMFHTAVKPLLQPGQKRLGRIGLVYRCKNRKVVYHHAEGIAKGRVMAAVFANEKQHVFLPGEQTQQISIGSHEHCAFRHAHLR